eukprot:gene25981-11667_t
MKDADTPDLSIPEMPRSSAALRSSFRRNEAAQSLGSPDMSSAPEDGHIQAKKNFGDSVTERDEQPPQHVMLQQRISNTGGFDDNCVRPSRMRIQWPTPSSPVRAPPQVAVEKQEASLSPDAVGRLLHMSHDPLKVENRVPTGLFRVLAGSSSGTLATSVSRKPTLPETLPPRAAPDIKLQKYYVDGK